MKSLALLVLIIATALISNLAHLSIATANLNIDSVQFPFIENQGQIDPHVSHYMNTPAGTLFVTVTGDLVLALPKSHSSYKDYLVERFYSKLTIKPTGASPSSTRVSYFKGDNPSKWKTNLPTFSAVSLGEIYPGIIAKLRAHAGCIEKRFEISAGIDPRLLQIQVNGADDLLIGSEGELTVHIGDNSVRYTAPIAFQMIDGKQVNVEAEYHLQGRNYGFKLGHYDNRYPLVIDPLLQATYIGGSERQ